MLLTSCTATVNCQSLSIHLALLCQILCSICAIININNAPVVSQSLPAQKLCGIVSLAWLEALERYGFRQIYREKILRES